MKCKPFSKDESDDGNRNEGAENTEIAAGNPDRHANLGPAILEPAPEPTAAPAGHDEFIGDDTVDNSCKSYLR